jgi:DNA-binding LacI/PurR family transcriptional regulator
MNIHDIAREAGVSTATVSRVINRSLLVGEGTRRRVQEVIDGHGYTPNGLARGLLQNRTRSIGVLIVDILNPYYATVVHAIERNLSAAGNSILLCNTGGSQEEKHRYITTLLEKRVDGLVFVGSVYREKDGSEDILRAARTVPVVMINSLVEADNVYCILCDDRRGIGEATEWLIDAGRKDILFVSTRQTASARLKEAAFLEATAARGIEGDRARVLEASVERLMDLPPDLAAAMADRRIDAILASDDLFANVAVNALHSMRIDIPGTVWVIGYNNSYVSEQTYPRLSSVDSRMEDIGVECAAVLQNALEGKSLGERIITLQPRLVSKDSSG